MSEPGEFELIARYFAPLATHPGADGLRDDAALLLASEFKQGLVVTTDASIAGVHFLPDEQARVIAQRCLRVNLSDLAAKGARPVGYLVSLSLPPHLTEEWVAGFADGLSENQQQFGWSLLGGDTVRTSGPLTVSVTAFGRASGDGVPRRSGATPGDDLWVSGTIGDGFIGLRLAMGEFSDIPPSAAREAETHFRCPEPRVDLGARLAGAGLVKASADVSDGLVADAGNIAAASGCGAAIEAALIPLSAAGRYLSGIDPAIIARLATGGDDYEIVFTAEPRAQEEIQRRAAAAGVEVTRIGRMEAGQGVRLLDGQGRTIPLSTPGFVHR